MVEFVVNFLRKIPNLCRSVILGLVEYCYFALKLNRVSCTIQLHLVTIVQLLSGFDLKVFQNGII